jgi:WS/DGAT/MGAT family acyltransferase
VALPKPGDWRQFCILASRLTRPHFDMSRPLWEMFVVEGLDNVDWLPKGCFAILTRLHHAAVDGTALAELTWGLHDLSVKGGKVKHPEVPDIREPSTMEMATRAWWNNASSPLRLARPLSNVLPVLGSGLMKMAGNRMKRPFEEARADSPIPKTRFNRRVSPHRVFTSTRFPLDECKKMRNLVPGSTINDVVVATIGGALRRYLDHHGDLPADTMVAAMPVNTRDPDADSTGADNQITFMAAAIGSDISDPVARLQFVYDNTSNSKAVLQGIGADDLTDINKHVPSALLAAAARMITTVGFDSAGTGKRLFNVAISNVPGPTMPIYLKGAQLRFWSVVGPLADGMGSIFAVTSYNGELFICPTACRDIVPDPEFLAECIEQSFAELQELS